MRSASRLFFLRCSKAWPTKRLRPLRRMKVYTQHKEKHAHKKHKHELSLKAWPTKRLSPLQRMKVYTHARTRTHAFSRARVHTHTHTHTHTHKDTYVGH
jgi:hypothetical protein